MLIAEAEDGSYEPVAAVSTVREARDMARDDYRRRIVKLDRGGSPLCPAMYKVWSRDDRGLYRVAFSLTHDDF